jgi:hypothetical protein
MRSRSQLVLKGLGVGGYDDLLARRQPSAQVADGLPGTGSGLDGQGDAEDEVAGDGTGHVDLAGALAAALRLDDAGQDDLGPVRGGLRLDLERGPSRPACGGGVVLGCGRGCHCGHGGHQVRHFPVMGQG